MQCRYFSYNLAFRHPFTISRGTKTHQPTLVVELTLGDLSGYGEAPAISYYNISVEKMIADLESALDRVESFSFSEPESFWEALHAWFPDNSFLVCALDMAAWDLYGKLRGLPLYKIWGLDPAKGPKTDYTIGIDSPEKMIQKLREKPWPIYKIKMGTGGDIDILKRLRGETDAIFRVDANGGWEVAEAMEKIPLLFKLGVEFVEQPLAPGNREGMKTLMAVSPLPLIADESCVGEEDPGACRGYFHGINIKLTKCGGLTPARRMIASARQYGLSCMAGSMNESSLGSAAIAQLLPMLDYVDMDGPLLLRDDLAGGLVFDQGRVIIPVEPGLGVSFTGPFKKS